MYTAIIYCLEEEGRGHECVHSLCLSASPPGYRRGQGPAPDTAYALGFPLMVAECHAHYPCCLLFFCSFLPGHAADGPPQAETRSSSRGGAVQGRPLGFTGLDAGPQATTLDPGAALTPRVLCCSRRDAGVLQSLPSSPRGTRHRQRES